MVELKTVPNEERCESTEETHELDLIPCCPISGNPLIGSTVSISYQPIDHILEVASLRAYLDSYKGGRGKVRSMEGMIQQIAQDCADILQTYVVVTANLEIEPRQRMRLKCTAFNDINPKEKGPEEHSLSGTAN